jgi:glycosyltransferase involved in cell wall biosynthesis
MPKPLTIGVDVRDLRVAKTGTKTYLEEICKEFKKMNSSELHFHFLDSSLPVYTGNIKTLKWIEHFKYQLWKQLGLPLKAFFKGCDIVFCTDNFVPLIHLGYKTIPVFHDAFFFETPENYGSLWLWLYKKIAIPTAKRSSFVVTPTEWSKKQISYFTDTPAGKLVVVPEGPKIFSGLTSDDYSKQILDSFSLTAHNYILHVGSMFKRKNLPALVHTFSKIKSLGYPGLKLVLAGSFSNNIDSDYCVILDSINNYSLQNDVVLTGYLNDGDLETLYKNATLYVFPSINEGFGIPVLEAFNHNLPVLVANNTCLPEVGGEAVLQFDPFDINDMASKIKTVLNNVGLQKDMINKGRVRLEDFSWKKTAVHLVEVFKKAVNNS